MSSRVLSLAPIVDDRTVALVLGSMPGKLSLEKGQYYANDRNQFWWIIHSIFGDRPGQTYVERVAFLQERGIGLWDVLRECSREGSLDSSIENAVPNDLDHLLARYPRIGGLFFNGAKAKEVFDASVRIDPARRAKLALALLPSTSPANTHSNLKGKLERWRTVRRYLESADEGR